MTLAFAPVGLPTFELPWQDILSSVVIGTTVQLIFETTIVVGIAVHLAKWLKGKNLYENSHPEEENFPYHIN
jgi:hypothetical protein